MVSFNLILMIGDCGPPTSGGGGGGGAPGGG